MADLPASLRVTNTTLNTGAAMGLGGSERVVDISLNTGTAMGLNADLRPLTGEGGGGAVVVRQNPELTRTSP